MDYQAFTMLRPFARVTWRGHPAPVGSVLAVELSSGKVVVQWDDQGTPCEHGFRNIETAALS